MRITYIEKTFDLQNGLDTLYTPATCLVLTYYYYCSYRSNSVVRQYVSQDRRALVLAVALSTYIYIWM